MDEFALHKSYRYATVIVEPFRRQVLWVGSGHSREAIHPFFEYLDEPTRQRIKSVVMDMNTAFDLEVQKDYLKRGRLEHGFLRRIPVGKPAGFGSEQVAADTRIVLDGCFCPRRSASL